MLLKIVEMLMMLGLDILFRRTVKYLAEKSSLQDQGEQSIVVGDYQWEHEEAP